MKINSSSRLNFGKYIYQQVEDVPQEYIGWCIAKGVVEFEGDDSIYVDAYEKGQYEKKLAGAYQEILHEDYGDRA